MNSDQQKLDQAFTQAINHKDERKLLGAIQDIAKSSKLSPEMFDIVMTRAVIGDPRKGNVGIHIAANLGFNFVIRLIIDSGGDVNIENMSGRSPLHFAAVGGGKDTIEILLSRGANINARNDQGKTPLDLALRFNNSDAIDKLERCGALRGRDLDSGFSRRRPIESPSSTISKGLESLSLGPAGR